MSLGKTFQERANFFVKSIQTIITQRHCIFFVKIGQNEKYRRTFFSSNQLTFIYLFFSQLKPSLACPFWHNVVLPHDKDAIHSLCNTYNSKMKLHYGIMHWYSRAAIKNGQESRQRPIHITFFTWNRVYFILHLPFFFYSQFHDSWITNFPWVQWFFFLSLP